jgi:predicted ATP-dependent endonuclease of OLD family
MSVKLQKVELLNYRSCLQTKVNVSGDLTTLIGVNGAGKSNILKGIQLLGKIKSIRDSDYYLTEEVDNYLKSSFKLDFIVDEKEFAVRIDVSYEINDKNEDEVVISSFKIRDKSSKSRRFTEIDIYHLSYAIRKRPSILTRSHLNRILNETNGSDSIEIFKFIKNIRYFSATQFSNPSKCPISFELDDTGSTRSSLFSTESAHRDFLYDLYNTFKSDQDGYLRFLDIVGKGGIGLIEEVEFKDYILPSTTYEVRSGGQVKQIERTKSLIIPNVKVDNIILSPNQLSEGTFKALALIYYILNDSSDLLLIEEPEVCVHFGLLNSIIGLIKQESGNKQIIVTTHSDSILDKLEPENVILVRKEAIKGTTALSIPESLSKDDYKALKSYLESYGNLGEYWREGGLYNG